MILLQYIAVGLGSGLLIIVTSKFIIARLFQRETSYYQDKYDWGGDDDE